MTDEELLNDLYYVKKNYDGVEGLYKKVKWFILQLLNHLSVNG
jgi:hypothetical protein